MKKHNDIILNTFMYFNLIFYSFHYNYITLKFN